MSQEIDEIIAEFNKMEEELTRIDAVLCFVPKNDTKSLEILLERNYEIHNKIKVLKEKIRHYFLDDYVYCER